MNNNIYISIVFHLTILFLIFTSSLGPFQPARVLTIPNEITISAEIINRERKQDKASIKRQKPPATAEQKSQAIFQDLKSNSPDVTDKETFPESSASGLAYIIKTSEESKTSLKPVNQNPNSYIPLDKGAQSNVYQTVYSTYSSDYLRIIREIIEKTKVYPALARKKGIEGKVFLRFKINPNGEVEEVKIIKSSGSEILDKTSIETLKRSAPLPYVAGWIELPLAFRLE